MFPFLFRENNLPLRLFWKGRTLTEILQKCQLQKLRLPLTIHLLSHTFHW
ncbi:conserved hypothetical protein [delta proteobacterium NaphS2]|nr:conserved hypothetical protein [delta proteobacterium NaphS2]